MAKAAAKGKWSAGKNCEFTVRGGKGAGTGGEKPDAISGPKRKGDSRSKSSMRPITPSKSY